MVVVLRCQTWKLVRVCFSYSIGRLATANITESWEIGSVCFGRRGTGFEQFVGLCHTTLVNMCNSIAVGKFVWD